MIIVIDYYDLEHFYLIKINSYFIFINYMNKAYIKINCKICNKSIQFANFEKHYRACIINSKKINTCSICNKDFPYTGRIKTICTKECLNIRLKNAFNNPITKEKMSIAKRGKKQNKTTIDKRLITMKKNAKTRGYWHSKETKEKISKANTGKIMSDEQNQRNSLSHKGKTLTEEHKQNISNALNSSKKFKLYKESIKGKTYEEIYGKEIAKLKKEKMSIAMMGHEVSEEARKNIGEKNKIALTGRKLTKEHVKNSLQKREKSSLEIKMENIINKYKIPFKFVGNGEFFIENKCPDFVHLNNNTKIVIEVYFRRHKEMTKDGGLNKWLKDREELFIKNGYKSLFFNETEVKDKMVLQKIINILY